MQGPVESASSSADVAWSANDLASNPHRAGDKADRVRRMFDAIARRYDLNNRLHSFGRDQAWRRRAVALADLATSDRVLDVACGTGDLTHAFADAGAAAVVGLDFTEGMLEVARHKLAKRDDGDRVRYVQGDAMALPFEDGRFEVLSIAFGVRNVAEPAKALAEFYRVLTPGGRLVVLEFSEPKNPLLRLGNSIYTRHVMPLTATLIARDRSGAYRYLPRSIATFLDREAMSDAITQAGFEDVEVHPMTFGVCAVWVARRG